MSKITEASRRGLLLAKTGKIAANLLAVNPEDPIAQQFIDELLAEDQLRIAQTAPFMKRQVNKGDIIIGEDPFDRSPHRQELTECTNTLSVGTTGSGKSTQIALLAPQFAVHGSNVTMVDSEKTELSGLIPVFEKFGKTLRVINGREFPFNPLEVPDGVNPFEYIEHIAITIGSALEILEPGIRLLKEVIYQQYIEHGVFEGSNHWPVLFETREKVAQHRTSNPLTREALLARIDSVLINTPGLRFRRGVNTQQLSKSNNLLECAGMSPSSRDLLIGTIVTKEFLRRKALGYVNASFDWTVILDDAQRFCANPEGHLARFVNVIRSMGMLLYFFVQSARMVAPAILANCATKYCGVLGSAEDSHFLARSMGLLSHEQTQWLATNLNRGQFLCQLGNGWRAPFLLEVRPGMVHDYLSPATSVPHEFRISDEGHSHDSVNQSDYGTEFIEAEEYRNWVPPEWRITRITEPNNVKPEPLTKKEQEFLSAVNKSPGKPCSSYNKNLSFSQKVAIQIRKALVEKGLLHEEFVRTQQYGRTAKLLTVTKAGEELLKQILK